MEEDFINIGKYYMKRISKDAPEEARVHGYESLEREILKEEFVIKERIKDLKFIRDIFGRKLVHVQEELKKPKTILRLMTGMGFMERGIEIGKSDTIKELLEVLDTRIMYYERLLNEK